MPLACPLRIRAGVVAAGAGAGGLPGSGIGGGTGAASASTAPSSSAKGVSGTDRATTRRNNRGRRGRDIGHLDGTGAWAITYLLSTPGAEKQEATEKALPASPRLRDLPGSPG